MWRAVFTPFVEPMTPAHAGVWSPAQRSRCRPACERMGDTAARSRKRSNRADNSSPVSGEGHSLLAATHSFRGTGRATPSPRSNVPSFRILSSVFRIALLAFHTSSMKQESASGSLPAVIRTYLSSLSDVRLTGPTSSSGVVNLVSRIENLLPPVQRSTLSRRRDFALPGGPTSSTCSPAIRAVRTRSISSSRSIRADDSSLRAWANLSRMSDRGRVRRRRTQRLHVTTPGCVDGSGQVKPGPKCPRPRPPELANGAAGDGRAVARRH